MIGQPSKKKESQQNWKKDNPSLIAPNFIDSQLSVNFQEPIAGWENEEKHSNDNSKKYCRLRDLIDQVFYCLKE